MNKKSLWIRVDGPYGDLNMNYRRYPVLLLVSGGIGVTPAMGILKVRTFQEGSYSAGSVSCWRSGS